MKKKTFNVPIFFSIFFLCSCSGGEMKDKVLYTSLKEIPKAKWEQLSGKTIYFGHMSVGYNILKGVEEMVSENSIPIKLKNSFDTADCRNAAFYHSEIGENTKPKTKIQAFESNLLTKHNCHFDIAFMKFCYVDFNSTTDVKGLFEAYQSAIAKIRKANKDVVIIHVTAPLSVNQTGIKALIKRVLGKPVYGVEENIKRNEFNAMINEAYSGKEPIFDLAFIESTKLDGNRTSFESGGKTYFQLNPEYSDDGGHLNEIGRRIAAEKLLVLIANQA